MVSASDIERLDVRTRTPGLLLPGIALTRVSPTKNRRRCSSSSARRSAGVAYAYGAVGSSPSAQPAITTTGELRPLLLCKLMIRTSATSGGMSGKDTAAIRASNSPAAVSATGRQRACEYSKRFVCCDLFSKPLLHKLRNVVRRATGHFIRVALKPPTKRWV